MKKGFTLVELLAVIAILGVIALIAVPAVDKAINQGKDQMLETQKAQIIKGAKDYLAVNTNKLPNTGASIQLYVGDLQDAGFLQLNIKNPQNDDYVSPNAIVTVKAIGNGYQYTVDESTLSGSSGSTGNAPTIVLNGGNIQYVELGSVFNDNGYTATSKYGADLTANVRKIIKNKSGVVVASISTSSLTTYTIEYTVSDPNNPALTTTVKRTIMVVDTTKPNITLTKGDYITITAMEVPGFNYGSLVNATDNSGATVNITYTSNLSQIEGVYYINYTAKDPSGNIATRKVTVKVSQGIKFECDDASHYTETKDVTIIYPTYSGSSYTNQYSLDYGLTWNTVSGVSTTITLNSPTTIIARLYDGSESKMAVTYTITNFSNS